MGQERLAQHFVDLCSALAGSFATPGQWNRSVSVGCRRLMRGLGNISVLRQWSETWPHKIYPKCAFLLCPQQPQKGLTGGRGWGIARKSFWEEEDSWWAGVQRQLATRLSAPTARVLTEQWQRLTEMAWPDDESQSIFKGSFYSCYLFTIWLKYNARIRTS